MQAPFLELALYVEPHKESAALAHLRSVVTSSSTGDTNALPEEIHIVGGRIIVRTEGAQFCGPMRRDTAKLRFLGNKIYKRFISVAETMDCLYGAILIEYSLESPQELREDPRSLAFRNFYLSRRLLPRTLIDSILTVAPPESFVEEHERGIYISTSPEFNPKGMGVESATAQNFSVGVGQMIGKAVA